MGDDFFQPCAGGLLDGAGPTEETLWCVLLSAQYFLNLVTPHGKGCREGIDSLYGLPSVISASRRLMEKAAGTPEGRYKLPGDDSRLSSGRAGGTLCRYRGRG